MHKLLAISIASASIAIGAIPAVAEVDSKIHALCLDAKDYSGCVKTQTSLSNRTKAATVNSIESEPSELTAWQRHLNENPNLKAWVDANPSLGEKKQSEWEQKNRGFDKNDELEEICFQKGYGYTWDGNNCNFSSRNLRNDPSRLKSAERVCPPGKSQYQKTALFGLIKGTKLCLTDYEAESLRQVQMQRALQNFSNSIRQPQVVNCYSNTYGNYTSTSCY